MILEWNALVAILVYAMLAGLLVKVLTIVMGNRQSDTHTITSSRIDNR
jgi:cytochrome b